MKRLAFALLAWLAISPAYAEDPARIYLEHCAACHGGDRLGAIGPALLPENLGRLRPAEAERVIASGRPATQMAGFGDKIAAEDIKALAAYIYTPLKAVPPWGLEEVKGSRIEHVKAKELPSKPKHNADPMNIFTVVESGDHHMTVLDGDRFEPLARFETRFALHGGIKYSPDGRFAYAASRDGWVSKYDLWSLQLVSETRVGINTRNIAVSADGRVVMAANMLPHTVVALDADLNPLKVITAADRQGKTSRVSAVYTAPPRKSFIVALKDIKELWELSYEENPKPVYPGFVHSHEKGMIEGQADKGPFPIRRIGVEDYLDDFFFDPPYRNLMGTSRAEGGGLQGQVVNLDVGRSIARLDLAGMPHLGSGIAFQNDGQWMLATPNLREPVISFIDMKNWQVVKKITTLGPGFFLRGHENTPYAWADVFTGPNKDTMQVIDTRTMEVVRTLKPEPGKTSGHVEFTKDGRFALVSVWEDDGALVIYDAATFAEVKRLPMRKPVGKYNVFNKINYSSGTSH